MGLLQLLLEGEGSFRPSSDKPRFSPEKEGPVYRSVQGQVFPGSEKEHSLPLGLGQPPPIGSDQPRSAHGTGPIFRSTCSPGVFSSSGKLPPGPLIDEYLLHGCH
eukprot:scaffold98273_cov23-Tisochrysis_lutea.AAC.3